MGDPFSVPVFVSVSVSSYLMQICITLMFEEAGSNSPHVSVWLLPPAGVHRPQ